MDLAGAILLALCVWGYLARDWYVHRHAHMTVSRVAPVHGWDEKRKEREALALRRRHRLAAKAARLLRRRR